MSGEIVARPMAAAARSGLTAGEVTGAVLSGMAGLFGASLSAAKGAIGAGAILGNAASERMENVARRRNERQQAELVAMAAQLDKLVRSRSMQVPPNIDKSYLEENRQNIQKMLANIKLDNLELNTGQYKSQELQEERETSLADCKQL